MTSLLQQLASLQDARNKNLKRFLAEYKAALLWNESEVAKSWKYVRALDPAFERCDPLFRMVADNVSPFTVDEIFSASADELEGELFEESKDVEFMHADEFEELNRTVLRFFQLIVPYFVSDEAQTLIDYLIFKYEAAANFPENIIATFVMHHDSRYYCKLLSLLTLPKDSEFAGLLAAFQKTSLDFTQPEYLNTHAVFLQIIKRFGVYKRVSSAYNAMARNRRNSRQAAAFLNALNTSYLMRNHKTMDDNEVRYMLSMVAQALKHPEDLDYFDAQACLMMSVAVLIQLTVPVQRELVAALAPILARARDEHPLSSSLLASFKNAVLVILHCLWYQKYPLDLLDEEMTELFMGLLRRRTEAELVFGSITRHIEGEFARLTELLFTSLTHWHFAKSVKTRMDVADTLADVEFLVNFASSALGTDALRVVFFAVLNSVNSIIAQVRAHDDKLVRFDRESFTLSLNRESNYVMKAEFYEAVLKMIAQKSPHEVEAALSDYLEELRYPDLENNIDLVLFAVNATSDDLFEKMTGVLAMFAEDAVALYKHLNPSFARFFQGLDTLPESWDDLADADALNAVLKHLSGHSVRTETLEEVLPRLLASKDREVRRTVTAEDFWLAVPREVANDVIMTRVQAIVKAVDAKFAYEHESVSTNPGSTTDTNALLAMYLSHVREFRAPLAEAATLARILVAIPNNDALDPSVPHYLWFLKRTGLFEEQLERLEDVDLEDAATLCAMLLPDPSRKTSRELFSPFALMARQAEAMRADASPAENSAQVLTAALIMDLVMTKFGENTCTEATEYFLYHFYWFFVEQHMARLLDPANDAIAAAKLALTVVSHDYLTSIFKEKIKNRSSEVCWAFFMACLGVFRIFGLNGSGVDFQDQIRVRHSGHPRQPEWRIFTPTRFRWPVLCFDYKSLLSDGSLTQFVARTHDAAGEHEPGLGARLFGDIGPKRLKSALKLLLLAFWNFEPFENAAQTYLKVLTNMLEYACFSDHKGTFANMLSDLSRSIKVTRLRQKKLKHPEARAGADTLNLEVNFSVDLRPLLDKLRNLPRFHPSTMTDFDIKSAVAEGLAKNEQLTVALATNLFFAGESSAFNAELVGWLAGVIAEGAFDVSSLIPACHNMLNAVTADAAEPAAALSALARTFPMVCLLHRAGALKGESALLQFSALLPRAMDLMLSIEQRFGRGGAGPAAAQTGSPEARLGRVAHDLGLVLVYLLRDLDFWSLTADSQRALYDAVTLAYGHGDAFEFGAVLKWLFGAEDDERLAVPFVGRCMARNFNEHALMHLLKSVKSLDGFEQLADIILQSGLNALTKAELVCKIVTNVAVSSDLANRKVQAFIVSTARSLVQLYSRFLQGKLANHQAAPDTADRQADPAAGEVVVIDSADSSQDSVVAGGADAGPLYEIDDEGPGAAAEGGGAEGHADELNAMCTAITDVLNHFCVAVTKFDAEQMSAMGRYWVEFYHVTCTFVKTSIRVLGTQHATRFVPLIANVVAAAALHGVKAKLADPGEAVRRAVTATVNNAVLNRNNYYPGFAEKLMSVEALDKMHAAIATTWVSYFAYLRVIRINLPREGAENALFTRFSAAVAEAKEPIRVLTNLVWFALCDGFELERLKVNLKRANGIEKAPASRGKQANGTSLEAPYKVHTFVHSFLQEGDWARIRVDRATLTDAASEAHARCAQLSELAHALFVTYVMLEHEDKLAGAAGEPAADPPRESEFPVSKVVAYSLKLIFRWVRANRRSNGGPALKLLAHGVLDAMFDNCLAKLAQQQPNVWAEGRNFVFDYHMLFSLVKTVNKLAERSDAKVSARTPQASFVAFKFERELERLHAETARALVDFFAHAEAEHARAPSEELFRMVSYARTEVWSFFANLPPRALEPLLELLGAALKRLREHHTRRAELGWTYVDLVYAAKVLLASGRDGDDGAPMNLPECAHTLRQTYEALLPLSAEVNAFAKLVLTALVAWMMRQHPAALNHEFYEFGLRLATEFDEHAQAAPARDAGATLEEAFAELVAMSIADCLRALEQPATLSCKALSRGRLLAEIAVCASRNMKLKTIIKPFAKIDALGALAVDRRMRHTSVLMAATAESIRASRPKDDTLGALRSLYLLCANVCAEFTFEWFFAGGAARLAEYNAADACDPGAGALSPAMFSGATHTFRLFEAAFIGLALSYFRLISANALLDLLEQQERRAAEAARKHAAADPAKRARAGVRTRVYLTVLLGAIAEFGRLGATNLLITRLHQSLEDVAESCAREAAANRAANAKVGGAHAQEMAFDNAWTWFANGRLALALVAKAVETWDERRGRPQSRAVAVPDAVFNSWLRAVRSAVAVFDALPINGDMELDNITAAWSRALEATLRSLVAGFPTSDDKVGRAHAQVAKIEACLSDRLATRSLNVKVACLALMDRLWDALGARLSPAIRNAMPAVGELVDDENDLVRRIAAEVEAKINAVLHEDE